MTVQEKPEKLGYWITPAKVAFLISIIGLLAISSNVFESYYKIRSDTQLALDVANDAKRLATEQSETSRQNNNDLSKQIQSLSDNVQQLALILREVQTVQRVQPTR